MPIYEAVCKKCGKYHEYVAKVADCMNSPVCCDEQTQKVIFTAPMGQFDIQPWEGYESPATGKWITSKAERKEDMKASKTRQWEGMETEKQEAARHKMYDEAEQDKKLDVAVRTAWAQLSPEKKALALKEA